MGQREEGDEDLIFRGSSVRSYTGLLLRKTPLTLMSPIKASNFPSIWALYVLLDHFSDPFKTSFKRIIKVDLMQILAVGAQSRSCLRLPSASCRKLNTLLKATVMLLWVSTTPVGESCVWDLNGIDFNG